MRAGCLVHKCFPALFALFSSHLVPFESHETFNPFFNARRRLLIEFLYPTSCRSILHRHPDREDVGTQGGD
ncbi:hypothetical protein BV898_10133 [Hypsibius exemplaris]|uniref:Uncharacterized protein n=1 Tax=Hypsibius exemplaris TaxID=2072580 RepID=A0A1W0WKL0_HYPEX|nr:hypothetical protein BV898_10133 [Hypsibius exemplaris]